MAEAIARREKFLDFAVPDIGQEEAALVQECLDSGWLTTGPKVRQFEEAFRRRVGSSYAVAVNSCTAAMHLCLEAVGLSQRAEVITSPFTFAATGEVICYFDATPVFADVDRETLSINPRNVEKAVTDRTRAIIPIHYAGLPADLEGLSEVASLHDLKVVEDAAHAFPAKYKKKMIGSVSDFTCFSFYATKTLTTGEGGMICTDREDWAEHCRIMSLHGLSRDAWNRYTTEGDWKYDIVAAGFKYNLTDLAAAIGLAQLDKADAMWKRRREIAARYQVAFESVEQLQVPTDRPDYEHAWNLYPLRLHLDRLRIDRGEFIHELKRRNIGCSVHFIPLHVHPFYRKKFGLKPEDFPIAYNEYLREVSLPIYSKMRDQDVVDVIEAVLDVVNRFCR